MGIIETIILGAFLAYVAINGHAVIQRIGEPIKREASRERETALAVDYDKEYVNDHRD